MEFRVLAAYTTCTLTLMRTAVSRSWSPVRWGVGGVGLRFSMYVAGCWSQDSVFGVRLRARIEEFGSYGLEFRIRFKSWDLGFRVQG
jgi:hypothetical protein